MTKTFKQIREINLNTALLKPRADQIRKQATNSVWNAADKKDMETAAKFLDKGDLKGFNKFIHTLDSFPRDEILHSAGLWNTKLPESMSYVGQNVSQKLSYDNWLKKIKGIEKGAHGIKGDEHTKLSKQWKDYRGQDKLAASYNEQVELEEGRMKELHTLIQQGKSAEEIAKIMKLDVKTIKSLMPNEAMGFKTHGAQSVKISFNNSTDRDKALKWMKNKEGGMHPDYVPKSVGNTNINVEINTATYDVVSYWEKHLKIPFKVAQVTSAEDVNEVSPPGWGGSVKAMKKHADIDNPYALAWHMKNKGDKPHYKDKDGAPVKKDKYKDEQMTEELTEKLEVKWDKDKEGWYDKQGRRRYLGKAATQDLLGKQIAKAKASGDWSTFDLDRSRFEEKETDMKKEDHDCAKVHPDKPHQEWAKDSLKKAQYETHKYFDTKPGSIEDSINKVKELEETSVTINKKEIDDLVKKYIAKGGVVTKLPPALAPDHEPSKEWDLVKGKSVPGSNQGQVAYKVKKVGSGYKILKAQLREFIRIYNEHFLTNYAAEEFIVEEEKLTERASRPGDPGFNDYSDNPDHEDIGNLPRGPAPDYLPTLPLTGRVIPKKYLHNISGRGHPVYKVKKKFKIQMKIKKKNIYFKLKLLFLFILTNS